MYDLRLHVIPLTNQEKDARGRPAKPYAVTPAEFAGLVERANRAFAGTNLRLVFDPALDWTPLANTELNTDGPNMLQRGNAIAARIPGKIVCFLRWGHEDNGLPTGNGNAFPPPGANRKPGYVVDFTQNYIALPNRIAPDYGLLNQGDFLVHAAIRQALFKCSFDQREFFQRQNNADWAALRISYELSLENWCRHNPPHTFEVNSPIIPHPLLLLARRSAYSIVHALFPA